jgi:hypothetical protein
VDDADMIAAITAGQLDGLAAALDKYARCLFACCQAMAPGMAAEAVRATFIVAWEKLGLLGNPDRLGAWLQAVAEAECLLLAPGGAVVPAAGTPPAAAELPPGLPGEIFSACADNTPVGRAHRVELAYRAGTFGHDGFPEPGIRLSRFARRLGRYTRLARQVAAAIVIAATAAAIGTAVLAGHSHHAPAAAGASGGHQRVTPSIAGPATSAPQTSPVPNARVSRHPRPRAVITAAPAPSPPARVTGPTEQALPPPGLTSWPSAIRPSSYTGDDGGDGHD